MVLPETAPSLVGFDAIPNDDPELYALNGDSDVPRRSFEPEEDGGDRMSGVTKHKEPHLRTLESIVDMIRIPQLQFCILVVLFKRIAFSSETLLYQYASDVLNAQLSQTAWLRALQAIGATFATGVAVPFLMQILERRNRQSSSSASFLIVQGSLAVLATGFVFLWLERYPGIIGIGTLKFGLKGKYADMCSNLPLWVGRSYFA